MKRTAALLLLLIGVPGMAWAQNAAALDAALIAQATGAAFSFMAPRTLEPIPIPQLAIWGLRNLVTLDPRLNVALTYPEHAAEGDPGMLTLGLGAKPLYGAPAPPAGDAQGWGNAVAAVAQSAWNVSPAVQKAGTPGLISGFFDELFNHLDPYSRYIPPEDASSTRARRGGRAGVGMTVAPRGGGFVVGTVAPGSPAAQAGLHVGDRILAIAGEALTDATAETVDMLLVGAPDSSVLVTVKGHDGHPHDISLSRAATPPETVFARRLGSMVIIQITSFSATTASRLAQELIRFTSSPEQPHGFVLDLRGNRGGLLQQAVAAAAMLQEAGIVAVTSGRAPTAAHVFIADGPDLAQALPVVVLVDGNSASAAEILAASLADQRRAVVVGSATLGKGLVQAVTELPDGGELVVTWSRVLAPLGWPLQGLGVLPQICTSLGPDVLARQLNALGRGVQPMQAALQQDRAARAPLTAPDMLNIRGNCPAAIGQDADLGTARYLIDTPRAYTTGLLAVPASAMPPWQAPPVTAGQTPPPPKGLTGGPVASN